MPAPLSNQVVLGASQTAGELAPFLIVLAVGFLVGAWGQSAKLPVAVVAGILLVILAMAGFMLENSSGPKPDIAP